MAMRIEGYWFGPSIRQRRLQKRWVRVREPLERLRGCYGEPRRIHGGME
jgi:hypothetical protein